MDRRSLLKGLVGVGAGLILPASVGENAETVRRYWSLDRTMVSTNNLELRRYTPEQLGAPYYLYTITGSRNGIYVDERIGLDVLSSPENHREDVWRMVDRVKRRTAQA